MVGKKLNKNSIGFEIEENYAILANGRIENDRKNYSNKKNRKRKFEFDYINHKKKLWQNLK